MKTNTRHQLIAATFANPRGGTRAATDLVRDLGGEIGNTAILIVDENGKTTFTETGDWGSGRGAIVGGALGLIGGPLGVLAGSGLGVIASRLRDSGFPDEELDRLGRTLAPGHSAVVADIAFAQVDRAAAILGTVGAERVVVQELDASFADLFTA